MGPQKPPYLAPVTEPVDVRSGHSGDDQARGHDSDPGKNLKPHRYTATQAKHLPQDS